MLSKTLSPARVQNRLLALAALFLVLYAAALTLSPAVRAQSWQVPLRWDHWIGVGAWAALFLLANFESARLSRRDPYLLPIAALLSGWGLMTIWRLLPGFGLRQTLWLGAGVVALLVGMHLPSDLSFLRRYKYLWLTSGLVLTGLTLLLGTNPSGNGFPHLWLGCCGVYLQPSEPLKLLLIVYLAAYLATGRNAGITPPIPHVRDSLLPLLAPTLLMTGLALALLLVQRDLGTASIFLFLYASIVYITSGRRRILAAGGLGVVAAGISGYLLFDVVRVRIDAWVNPWLDPSGRSYQIVQSLLAVANGGLFGRGPGMGSPGLVPVPHSDFIFASLMEETGLVGGLALLGLIGLLTIRGLVAALYAPDRFRRYLAAGLSAFLAGQSILIVGGNLRLLPLTGVTLPFVSYGGSSLLTSFLSLLLLLHISNRGSQRTAPLPAPRPYLQLGAFLLLGLLAAGLVAGWWAIYRGPALLTRTDNPRRSIADRSVRRGALLDRDSESLNYTIGESGNYSRQTDYPDLSNLLGYNHPVYGQAGLEASLDGYLRGLQGNPGLMTWWNHLLYGLPSPGLNVRLSLDLDLQRLTDAALQGQVGAAVLLNADNGELLAVSSHPSFDANTLDATWSDLLDDPQAPLLNRAVQGLYAPGPALGPLLLAAAQTQGTLPVLPSTLDYELAGTFLHCAGQPADASWNQAVMYGCPGPVAALGEQLGAEGIKTLYQNLGLFNAPALRLPTSSMAAPLPLSDAAAAAIGVEMQVNPLQMALAAAALTASGERPAPRLVLAVNTPQAGWVPLETLGTPTAALDSQAAEETVRALTDSNLSIWQSVAVAPGGARGAVTWFLGGTLPGQNTPALALAVAIEGSHPELALQIGQGLLVRSIQP